MQVSNFKCVFPGTLQQAYIEEASTILSPHFLLRRPFKVIWPKFSQPLLVSIAIGNWLENQLIETFLSKVPDTAPRKKTLHPHSERKRLNQNQKIRFSPESLYNTGNSDQIGEDFLKYFPVTSH